MSQEAREWLGLVAVVMAGMSFVSLLIWIQAADRGRARARTLKALGLVWGAVLVSVAGGWLISRHLPGAVFEVQVMRGFRVLVTPMSSAQKWIFGGSLGALAGLYVVAFLAVRRLLAPEAPDAAEIPTEAPTEGEEQ